MDSGFDAEPVIGPRGACHRARISRDPLARTRWHRPGAWIASSLPPSAFCELRRTRSLVELRRTSRSSQAGRGDPNRGCSACFISRFNFSDSQDAVVFEVVIASEAKQSRTRQSGKMDCFVAALLAMTALQFPTQLRNLAARFARVVRQSFAPKIEGVGNAGCPMHPQPRVRSLSEAHERSHHRSTGNHPAFPHAMVYGLFRALPGDEFVLSPSSAD